MKVIKYSSENFWDLLDEHLSLRQIETDVKIDQKVKSILEDVKKFGDDKIIQFAKDFDKVSIKKKRYKNFKFKKIIFIGSIK
jgi:histidinol dehydrogenase